jgi:hypothetical protein
MPIFPWKTCLPAVGRMSIDGSVVDTSKFQTANQQGINNPTTDAQQAMDAFSPGCFRRGSSLTCAYETPCRGDAASCRQK